MDVPVGKGTLGRVLDALGNPFDGKGGLKDPLRGKQRTKQEDRMHDDTTAMTCH